MRARGAIGCHTATGSALPLAWMGPAIAYSMTWRVAW